MALYGIDPVLNGELLAHLDAMGHSDAVVIVDAHFPARRIGARCVDIPGLDSPRVTRAIRSVITLDTAPAAALMATPDGVLTEVQRELIDALGVDGAKDVEALERFAFYQAAAGAYLVVRTGESRPYGNLLVRKGTFPLAEPRSAS